MPTALPTIGTQSEADRLREQAGLIHGHGELRRAVWTVSAVWAVRARCGATERFPAGRRAAADDEQHRGLGGRREPEQRVDHELGDTIAIRATTDVLRGLGERLGELLGPAFTHPRLDRGVWQVRHDRHAPSTRHGR